MEELFLEMDDKKRLFYRVWRVDNPKATLHINHGMAEHSARYDYFATKMNEIGIVVFAQDHRGHGRTKENKEEEGWFGEKDGWMRILNDSWALDREINREYPNIPHFIMGHSMGSFLTRTNIALHSDAYRACIIMGSGYTRGLVGKIGRLIAILRAKRYGSKHKDEFLNNLAFGSYVKHFDYKNEGIFSWLSSKKDERKKYEEDEDCGFICSSQFYADLIEGLEKANNKKLILNIRKDLPILFVSGDRDPVGGYGKGIKKAIKLYKNAGIKDVRLKLYKDGRHEILNDIMRDEVIKDCQNFLLEFIR